MNIDDVAVFSSNNSEHEKMYVRTADAAKRIGLAINKENTKFMLLSRRQREREKNRLKKIELVDQLKHLRIRVINDNYITKKFEARIELTVHYRRYLTEKFWIGQ